MILKNANVWGKITDIKIENKKIVSIGYTDEKGIDLNEKTVIPGMVDTHTHGCMGYEALDCNLEEICLFLARRGTTSFLPTTVTSSIEKLKNATFQKTDYKGAKVLGYHIEGPYISLEYKGAQDPKFIKNPDLEEIKALNNVKVVTIAPELEGADEFIKNAPFAVSLGHTSCDFDTAAKAFDLGASSLTHTCNAMKPLLHRNPGPIGAALMKNAYIELIGDMVHVHPAMVMALYKMFGSDRVILISDSLSATGLEDGKIMSGDLEVFVKDGKATLKDGTIAGSTSTLFECVKKVTEIGIPFYDAVKMATQTPAARINARVGKIAAGYDADLLILDKNNNIESIIIDGEYIY